MADFLVTGPAHIFFKFPGQSNYLYYGTTETTPQIRVVPAYKPVFNNIAGTEVPMDKVWQGEYAAIVIDMNRTVESVYATLQQKPRFGQGALAVAAGSESKADRGLLLNQNGTGMQLVLAHQYYNLPQAVADLPAGYTFYSVSNEADDQNNIGTVPRNNMLMMVANPIYYPLNSGNANAGGFLTYTRTVPTGLPTPS